MNKKTPKVKPTREQLAALSAVLADAPAISNDAQAQQWASIGSAQGWAAMDASAKAAFRVAFNSAK
jgi:hypothetical protein